MPSGLEKSELNHDQDPKPFKRWLNTLQRRHQPTRHPYPPSSVPFVTGSSESIVMRSRIEQRTSRASDSSSHAFITAVRSATVTLAETSIAPKSWIGERFGHIRGRLSRSAHGSHDSTSVDPIWDELAWSRSVHRRKILEEVIESEESYVADLKVLVNVSPSSNAQRSRYSESLLTSLRGLFYASGVHRDQRDAVNPCSRFYAQQCHRYSTNARTAARRSVRSSPSFGI